MTVTKDTTTALDGVDVSRKNGIDASDYLEMAQRRNASYERTYDEAAPGAAGKTVTAQSHDANGNGRGIRRGGSGSWCVPGGGESWTGNNVFNYTLSDGGHCWVSPGIQQILIIALVGADSTERQPYARIKASEAAGTVRDTYSEWVELTDSPDWYFFVVPVTHAAPNLNEYELELEVKLNDPDGSTDTTITLYVALPLEHADEPI